MTRSARFTCFCTTQTSTFQQNVAYFLFSVFNVRNAKTFAIISDFVAISLILMNFAWSFSDFVENAEKRCSFSKSLDFNLVFIMIIPDTHLIFRFDISPQSKVKPLPPGKFNKGEALVSISNLSQTIRICLSVANHIYQQFQSPL